MPVAHAPATEMCGSEPRLASAQPRSCSQLASSPYRRPALTVTWARSRSSSSTRGSPATETSTPPVSATSLNECPVPSARTRGLAATTCCSSATDPGRLTCVAPKVMLPAQFVSGPVMRSSCTICSPGKVEI